MSWPALHTPKGAVPGWRAFLGAAVTTIVAPVLLGMALFVLASAVFGHQTETGAGSFLFTIGFFLAFSFYLSWVGIVIALPFALLAFRNGVAGWGSALVAGLLVGALIFAFLGMAWIVTLPAGLIFAAVFWLSLRWMAPASFAQSQ